MRLSALLLITPRRSTSTALRIWFTTGAREIAYIIAAVTGGNEPSEKGYFYTATTQTCGPGFAMKFNEDEDDYPEIISPDEVKAILGEAGKDA